MTMRDALLPTHPRTGLVAIGWTSRGPVWPVLGGSEDDEPVEDDTSDEAEEPDEPDEDDEDEPLGPKGEKALQAEKTKRRAEASRRRTAEALVKELTAQIEAAKKPTKPDAEGEEEKPDADELRRQIQAELATETARERVLDKIEVKAARGFADPADAVSLLMRDHSADDFLDDGKPDVEAIQEALDELLEKKPYLGAAQGGKRFKGSADGGAKPIVPSRPKSLQEAVERKFSKR